MNTFPEDDPADETMGSYARKQLDEMAPSMDLGTFHAVFVSWLLRFPLRRTVQAKQVCCAPVNLTAPVRPVLIAEGTGLVIRRVPAEAPSPHPPTQCNRAVIQLTMM